MVGTAPCVVVAQQEKRMRPLPYLGRLALECSTGTNAAEAARDAVVTDNDLLLLILTARTSEDACELAANWWVLVKYFNALEVNWLAGFRGDVQNYAF